MNTDSFIIHFETEDVYEDFASDVEKLFDTSNYNVNRPLPTERKKKVIGLMKDELGEKIMTEFVALRPKTYSYLMDNGNSDKRAKGTKKCAIKRKLEFNDCKGCLFKNKIILTLYRMGLFRCSLKSVTHILQRRNLAHLYLI